MNYWPKSEYLVGERIPKYNPLAIMHHYTTTGGHFNICKFQLTMLMRKYISVKIQLIEKVWIDMIIDSQGTSQGTGAGNGKYVLLLLTKFFSC